MIPEMLSDINTGLKLFKLISQRNFLTKCRKLKICPPEIRNLASRINSDKRKQASDHYEDIIMKARIKSAIKEVETTRRLWNVKSKNLRECRLIPNRAKKEFDKVKRNQIQIIKYEEYKHKSNKISKLLR